MKKFFQFGSFLLCLIYLITFSACEDRPIVRLCDYKSFNVEEEVYEVAKEDLSFAIKMKLIEKDVLIPKSSKVIEDFDVVDIALSKNGGELIDYRIIIGNAEINEELDAQLIGLSEGNTYIFVINETEYSATINAVYVYAEEITDDIARDYFYCDSSIQFVDNVRREIEEHRKFEFAYEKLIMESYVRKDYNEKDLYEKKIFDYLQAESVNNEISLEQFLNNDFGCSIREYRVLVEDFYDEYMILKAFAEAENITANDKEFDLYLDELSDGMSVDKRELINLYGEEYIYYSIYYDKAYEKLLNYL